MAIPIELTQAPNNLQRVFEPLQLGPVTIPNRIFEPAHSSQYGDAASHEFSSRQVAFFRERAKGELGLSITETVAAARSALGSFYHIVNVWDQKTIPSMARLADAVHAEGGEIFIQLAGPGANDKGGMFIDETRPLWGAGNMPSIVYQEQTQIASKKEIRELAEDFGQSAANVKTAGMRGIEINGAHGYMHAQWLSPTYNRRTDEYGGSVANRTRFALETVEAIRERVGSDFVVGYRLSWDEYLGAGGNTGDDSAEQLEIMAASGLFDYFNIATGGYITIHHGIPGMESGKPDGWLAPASKRAKEIVGDRAKILMANSIRDLHTAEQIIADGAADAIGMARQILADPFIVKKTREGREREIIRCNRNNECAGRLWEHRELVCALNPATGREEYWGEGSLKMVSGTDVKKIVVVGGGPGGMKVAAVAARRGHDVTLLEASDSLGGHLKLLYRLPGLQEWDIAIDNLVREMENTGVDVRMNTRADIDSIKALAPDSVIIATGAHYEKTGMSIYRPERDGIPGAEADSVIDVHTAAKRAIADGTSLGKKVLILDESSGHLPLAVAELLADNGVEVEIVTPRNFVGEKTHRNIERPFIFVRLDEKKVKRTTEHFIEDIVDDKVRIHSIWSAPETAETRTGIDTVILSLYRSANDDLFAQADGQFDHVERVGDVAAPRDITAALHDAEKIGRAL